MKHEFFERKPFPAVTLGAARQISTWGWSHLSWRVEYRSFGNNNSDEDNDGCVKVSLDKCFTRGNGVKTKSI